MDTETVVVPVSKPNNSSCQFGLETLEVIQVNSLYYRAAVHNREDKRDKR